MQSFLYILYSSSLQKNYIGFTANLQQRLEAHNHPKNKMWSRFGNPWTLKAYFVFADKAGAMAGEKHLKSLRSPEYIDNLIREGWVFNGQTYQAQTSLEVASDPD
jgi:putative endonuclease